MKVLIVVAHPRNDSLTMNITNNLHIILDATK